MADTRMKLDLGHRRGDDDAGTITINVTVGMRIRLAALANTGIFGHTLEDICERFVCNRLWDLEKDKHQ